MGRLVSAVGLSAVELSVVGLPVVETQEAPASTPNSTNNEYDTLWSISPSNISGPVFTFRVEFDIGALQSMDNTQEGESLFPISESRRGYNAAFDLHGFL